MTWFGGVAGVMAMIYGAMTSSTGKGICVAGLTFLIYWFNLAPGISDRVGGEEAARLLLGTLIGTSFAALGNMCDPYAVAEAAAAQFTVAGQAVGAVMAYVGFIGTFLALEDIASG